MNVKTAVTFSVTVEGSKAQPFRIRSTTKSSPNKIMNLFGKEIQIRNLQKAVLKILLNNLRNNV